MAETPNQHLAQLQKMSIPASGMGAGSYGTDLNSAFVDPVSGQQVSGMGFVPMSDGTSKTISELILGARNPKNLGKIRSQLIQYGLIGKNVKSSASVQSAWQQVVINASTSQLDPVVWMKQAQSGGFGQDTASANLPSRQIYKYTDADKQKWIEDASQALRGQAVTPEDKQSKWYQDLKSSIDNMINTGSVTTSKDVYNPKTKKTESVFTTVPGFSTEQATATAEKAIRAGTPQDVERQDRVQFTSWMFNALGGANG
jgi:hypothetical protein